ncbi:MAG: hypothetical protein OQK51_14750 [Kangiellaceae bacterium]|nr:hypothetical protein [Kangiellaceae bacterium]
MILKSSDDTARSKELLKAKEEGVTFANQVKKSAPLFIIRLIAISFCIWIYADNHENGALFLFAGGVLLGALAQDLGWFLRVSNNWQFTESVTDWEKVKAKKEDKD